MVDEEVLVALVRGDEAEPLVVAEELDGSLWHGFLRCMCHVTRRKPGGDCCEDVCTAAPGSAPAEQGDRSSEYGFAKGVGRAQPGRTNPVSIFPSSIRAVPETTAGSFAACARSSASSSASTTPSPHDP